MQAKLLAELSLSEKITLSTVRIETQLADGSTQSGTGFFYNFLQDKNGQAIPAIVTNKHVIKGAALGRIYLNKADADGKYVLGSFEPVMLPDGEKNWILHPDENVDLAILLVGPFFNEQLKAGKKFSYTPLDESLIPTDADNQEFTAIEDIVMVGYPDGIWDEKNNRPIVRRGITATQPSLDYGGKKEFLIDAACFPGSSGSPVLLFNQGSYPTRSGALAIGTRIKLLGILYAGPQHFAIGDIRTVPMADRTISVSAIPNNLGCVIKAEQLKGFEPQLKAMLEKSNQGAKP